MDWIAYLFLILQMWLLSYKPKAISNLFNVENLSFVCGMIGCLFLILFGFGIGSTPMMLTNMLLFFLNFKGYIK